VPFENLKRPIYTKIEVQGTLGAFSKLATWFKFKAELSLKPQAYL
jgi:hypothetical protein